MTRESGFTLLHHYSCIVKFPCFFAAVFTSQLSSFHLKYTFPINLPSTNEISQLILHLRLKPQSLYLHHTLLSQVTSTIVWFKFWNSWLKSVFFYPSQQILWTNCFFQFLAWNGGFFHPSRICTRNLLPYMTVYSPSERACEESFWTSCEWSQALRFYSYTIYTRLMCIC